MPLTYRSHVIGLLRGRRAGGAGGYSVLPGVPLKVWLIKRVVFLFFLTLKVLRFTLLPQCDTTTSR